MVGLRRRKRSIVWLAWVLLLGAFIISACNGGGSSPTAAGQIVAPVVVVTQVVVEVVATLPPPTATQVPSPTVALYQPAPGWNPASAPIYYPLAGCVASRLHLGDTAFVATLGAYSRLYLTKDIFNDPGTRSLVLGEQFMIVDGPWCDRDILIWKLKTKEKDIFYTPEGNGEVYWLLPLNPYIPTLTPTPFGGK